MAYKIRYDSAAKPLNSHFVRVQAIMAAFLLAFIFCINILSEQGSQMIRNYLLPQENMTVTAAETLVTHLENGVSFMDAIDVFCESILHGE